MLFGALLVLTWLVLLLRYPEKALRVSFAAVCGLALVVAAVLWQEQRTEHALSRLELRLDYAPQRCPPDRPLAASLANDSGRPLLELHWRIAAYPRDDDLDLVEERYDAPRYHGPGALQPGSRWSDCLPLPALRPGYRPETLDFRPVRLQGRFAD